MSVSQKCIHKRKTSTKILFSYNHDKRKEANVERGSLKFPVPHPLSLATFRNMVKAERVNNHHRFPREVCFPLPYFETSGFRALKKRASRIPCIIRCLHAGWNGVLNEIITNNLYSKQEKQSNLTSFPQRNMGRIWICLSS